MDPRRAWRVLCVGLLAYCAAATVAAHTPGPRAWGLHLAGFLPKGDAVLVWTGLLLGTALVVTATVRPQAATGTSPPSRSRLLDPESPRSFILFLAVWTALLWLLRVRTNFLGDGSLWLSSLVTGEPLETHEPLAEGLWVAAARLLRHFGAPITAGTVAPVSIACGVLAGAITWMIAREIARAGSFGFTLVLLLTVGTGQLFFGYIESYPPVAVLILAFLWLGIRSARAGSGLWGAGVALSLAVQAHLACLFLVPGYVYLVATSDRCAYRKTLYLFLPFALGAPLLVLSGFGPERWAEAARVALEAFHRHGATLPREVRPYGPLSLDHGIDIANEVLLVIPVPFLLVVSGLYAGGAAMLRGDRRLLFLAVTAACGLAAVLLLVLPVAAAQDWDLFALFLIPTGVLGVCLAAPLTEGQGALLLRRGLGLFAISTLAAFVLVNAITAAGTRRYEVLLGPGAKITPFARTYGYEFLAYFHRHQGDRRRALAYAEALLREEPTNHRFWAMAGSIRMSQGDYGGAVRDLEEAVRRGRESAGTWVNLGISYTGEHRNKEALACFEKAVALEPDRPEYRMNYALGLLNSGSPDSARAVLSTTVHRWPGYTPAKQAFQRYFGGRAP